MKNLFLSVFFPSLKYQANQYHVVSDQLGARSIELTNVKEELRSAQEYYKMIISFMSEYKDDGKFKVIDSNDIRTLVLHRFTDESFECCIKIWEIKRNAHDCPAWNYPCMKLEGKIRHLDYDGGFWDYISPLDASEPTCFWISDITSGADVNKGIGSILLSELISFSRKNKCVAIKGELGPADLNDTADPEHKSRLLHFYKKSGFEITLNDDERSGKIFLKL